VVYFVSRHDREEAEDERSDETATVVASIADQYDALLSDTRTLLHAIASISADEEVLAQCGPALAALTRQSPTLENLVVYGADGRRICSAEPANTAVDTERTEWFREALAAGDFVGLESGPDGPENLTVAISREDGSGQEYAVAAEIAVGGLGPLVDYARISEDASVTILDEDDTVLFQTPEDPELVGEEVGDSEVIRDVRGGEAEDGTVADGPDGVRRIYSAKELSEPAGATVIGGIPTRVAYEDSARSFRTRTFLLIIAALLALAIALAFAHLSVIRRIRQLVARTRRIGAGDLSAQSPDASGDEIGELGRSLESMAQELREREIERGQLMTAVVEASEEERKRIAGDVHDDSIQVMSAHVMNLQLLRRRVDDPDLQHRIRELESSGRDATTRLRDLVFELHSPSLDTGGLRAALETLIERTFEGENVTASVKSTLHEEPPVATTATAYRIAQEAVRNARLHARAQTVQVEVERDRDHLVVRVVDDGVWFEPDEIGERPGHLGLRGMHERAAAIGGVIEIDAESGRGTTVVCRLPWLSEIYAESPSTS
ncbi:MAG: sensor histidine kinase, partial [Acidimicrobiia bacterium]